MSPRGKCLAIFSALGIVSCAFYYIPIIVFTTFILAVCLVVCFYHRGEALPARLGLNPRAGLNVLGVLKPWLWGWGGTGVSLTVQGIKDQRVAQRSKSSRNKVEFRESERQFRERFGDTGIYRREALETDSFLVSPREFLMWSYIGKADSPTPDPVRPRAGRNPREQLREKLSRPNHAVYNPNRRLSFAGESPGTPGRFTITPQRHYPLQRSGVSSVGVLPPVGWDGFRKKNILSPRNVPAAFSPVTVKIARPDHHSCQSLDLSCVGLPRAPADPCSRESVLKVLKESRKREVEEEDRSFTTEQRSKRRRNDSDGSAHSAFGPLLLNGAPSQLVPKPGSLKRGMTSLMEESTMKRSRTSSISSGSGVHSPRGTPGTARNPIHSSYSSSRGLIQWKKTSAPSSPLSSPGSSRCQTPEGASKRSREDDGQSPSSASSVKSDQAASNKAPVNAKLTPVSEVPVTATTNSTGSGGKRKRKIQLVSSQRDDQISLPPPPELGYTITVKDLDEEKRAAISKIQKILETPAPEPAKPVSPPAIASTQRPLSTTTTSLSSLLAAPLTISSTSTIPTTSLSSLLAVPLTTSSTSNIPVINLDPGPVSSASTVPKASNPLLDALKMQSSISASFKSTANTTAVSAPTTSVQPSGLNLKVPTSAAPLIPHATLSQSSSAGVEQPSAFTQVLGQVSKASSSMTPATGAGLFGPASQSSTPAPSSVSNSVIAAVSDSNSGSVSNTNPLLASGFKPIFAVATPSSTSAASTQIEGKPVQSFKPIFGSLSAGAIFGQPSSLTTTNSTSTVFASTSSMFGGSTNSTTVTASVFPGMMNAPTGITSTSSIPATQTSAQPVVKPLFGNWSSSTASTSSSSVAPTATTAASTNGNFTFGATQPDPQAAHQKIFTFGQASPSMNTTTAIFGGFAMDSKVSSIPITSSTTTTTAAASTTQSTFTFGKSSFQAPVAQSTFGSSTAAQPKPFTFGGSAASNPTPTLASNPTPPPFPFGAAAVTTATTFGNPVKPVFGAGSTSFSFGGTTTPAMSSAAPSFGAASQAQSSSSATFTFGGAAQQAPPSGPTQSAPSGFNFGAGMPQFGTPVTNTSVPQMGSFNFGAAAIDKPAFGTSTPSFGQSAPAGPIPFGSPGTPVQGFNPVPFGSPATPSFSIGAGSKPSGARQRLQARRQHNRKK
ncbi:nuclear envelope pore membrane protein POM 121 [Antennarius striatus]|uniref:nuclear envelope pore membrane protein POM 121 n=1 Tax=Antennarius striatus TaxID=241820 RepID=UPI0035B4BAE5